MMATGQRRRAVISKPIMSRAGSSTAPATDARSREILDGPILRGRAAARYALAVRQRQAFRPFSCSKARRCSVSAVALDVAAVEWRHCYHCARRPPAMTTTTSARPADFAQGRRWDCHPRRRRLNTLAFEILAEPGPSDAPASPCCIAEQCLAAAEKLAAARPPTVEEIERLQAMKTGALIGFSAEAGAILAQAEAGARAALRRYGEALGLAFQIADDLLDAEGDAAILGKRVRTPCRGLTRVAAARPPAPAPRPSGRRSAHSSSSGSARTPCARPPTS
jgi:hypothetical protein